MFLVDNFKILLLVGLIYTAGIPSSSAYKCNGGPPISCQFATLCRVDTDGNQKGCLQGNGCVGVEGDEFTCRKSKGCCCGYENCDDLSNPNTFAEQCKIEALRTDEKCPPPPPTQPPPPPAPAPAPKPDSGVKTTTAAPALTCVKRGQPEKCKAGKVCKVLKNGTQVGCAVADANCKAGPLKCGADHCCCGDGSDCNAVEPNSVFCTKFPTVMGCSSGSSSTSGEMPVVCSKDSTPCAPGQVCKIDKEGMPAGCTPATEDCKKGALKCGAEMCCCSTPLVKCDSEKEYGSLNEACKHTKLKEKLKETTCKVPTTTGGPPGAGSAAAGLFQHFYGGSPLVAFLSASMYFLSLKSLL